MTAPGSWLNTAPSAGGPAALPPVAASYAWHPFTGDDPLDDPYLNLVATQHNAYLVPSNELGDHKILEVDASHHYPSSDDASSGAPDRSDVAGSPDRTFDVGDSSTVMGAITLLGFLNLLGYIQSVLSVGRRRRSVQEEPKYLPVPPVPNLLQEILSSLSLWATDSHDQERLLERSRLDPPSRRTVVGGWTNLLTRFSQRFKLAANVMGFLANPEPSRVRRALEDATGRAIRSKRFTSAMNAWYDDLAGMNYDGTGRHASADGGQLNSLLSNIMLGLGRQFLGR